MVDVNLLRAALGLPLHDMLNNGIFHNYGHNETTGPDVEDTDHGAVQPPQQSTAPPSSSTRTLPVDNSDIDSNSVNRNEAV